MGQQYNHVRKYKAMELKARKIIKLLLYYRTGKGCLHLITEPNKVYL